MKATLRVAAWVFVTIIAASIPGFSQSCNLVFSAVGSPQQFNSFAYAAAISRGATNFFSVQSGPSPDPMLVGTIDPRPPAPNLDGGDLWVAWDNQTTPNVWFYLRIDSAVANRAFFGVSSTGIQAVQLGLDPSLNGGPGTDGIHNLVIGQPDTSTVLPSNVFACINGANFNVALTDVRPEDAIFANTRALNTYNAANLDGLGYNSTACGATANVGCYMVSSFSKQKIRPVAYVLFGKTDPFTGGKSKDTFTTFNVGVAPIIVFVSNKNTSNGGFGSTVSSGGPYLYTNVMPENLSLIAQGLLDRTLDLRNLSGCFVPGCPGQSQPLAFISQAPISDNFNVMEFTGVRTAADDNTKVSQELGNNPATANFLNNTTNCKFGALVSPCDDPLFLKSSIGGLRLRALGAVEEVKAVVGAMGTQTIIPDRMGYAFWSYGNFASAIGLAHYLTVAGVDPLFNAPGDTANLNGAYNIPSCPSLPCVQGIPFTHIKDGSYPLWNMLRATTFVGSKQPKEVSLMVAAAQLQAADTTVRNISEFVPYTDGKGDLNFWMTRSHYEQSAVGGNNGYSKCSSFAPLTGCLPEKGGDMGGSVVTVLSDSNYDTDFGKEILNLHQ